MGDGPVTAERTERAVALDAMEVACGRLLDALDAWQRDLSEIARMTDWRTVGEWADVAHTTAMRWASADPPHIPPAAATAARNLTDRHDTKETTP